MPELSHLVVVMRHGQRLDQVVKPEEYSDEVNNTPLSPIGHAGAAHVAGALASIPGAKDRPWVVVSSPFVRALQTAGGVLDTAASHGLALVNRQQLYVDFGVSEVTWFDTIPVNIADFSPTKAAAHAKLDDAVGAKGITVLDATVPAPKETLRAGTVPRFLSAIDRLLYWHCSTFDGSGEKPLLPHLLVVSHGCMQAPWLKRLGVPRPRTTRVSLCGFVAAQRTLTEGLAPLRLEAVSTSGQFGVAWAPATDDQKEPEGSLEDGAGDGPWTVWEGAHGDSLSEASPVSFWPTEAFDDAKDKDDTTAADDAEKDKKTAEEGDPAAAGDNGEGDGGDTSAAAKEEEKEESIVGDTGLTLRQLEARLQAARTQYAYEGPRRGIGRDESGRAARLRGQLAEEAAELRYSSPQ